MENINRTVFDAINGYKFYPLFDSAFAYLHGFSNIEITFFLFCLILFLIVMEAPKRGPRAAGAVFIASMVTYFGAGTLGRILPRRPYPFTEIELADMNLRLEILENSTAFPVVSSLMLGTLVMAFLFYFPKQTLWLIVLSVIYALMPVYLGVSYPIEALSSLFVGMILGFVQMNLISKMAFFRRY